MRVPPAPLPAPRLNRHQFAREVAAEHVAWAMLQEGMRPGSLIVALGVQWYGTRPTWEDALHALTRAWLALPEAVQLELPLKGQSG
jgi:hypothetical protein